MEIPQWVKALMAASALVGVALLVLALRGLGVGALIFAVVVGIPIFMYGKRRGKRAVEQEERRCEASEASRRRTGRSRHGFD